LWCHRLKQIRNTYWSGLSLVSKVFGQLGDKQVLLLELHTTGERFAAQHITGIIGGNSFAFRKLSTKQLGYE